MNLLFGTNDVTTPYKKIIIDDNGPNGTPLVANITAVDGMGDATIDTAPSSFTMKTHVTSLTVGTGPTGTSQPSGIGFKFGSSQDLTTADGVLKGTPDIMTAAAYQAVPVRSGTGGAGGTVCTVTVLASPTHQVALAGRATSFQVTIASGGGIGTVNGITYAGEIIGDSAPYNSSGYYQEPVSGCGLSGNPAIAMAYTILAERVVLPTGALNYNSTTPMPPCTNPAGIAPATNDRGTGLYLTCTISFGTVSFGTDNTLAFANAVNYLNRQFKDARGAPVCAYLPAGSYLSSPINPTGTNTTVLTHPGCWLGDERYGSTIFMIPNTSGDMFAWYNSYNNGSQQPFGNTITYSNFDSSGTLSMENRAGAAFRNITVIGNRASATVSGSTTTPAIQNALAFYGANQFVYIDNCVISYVRGHAIAAGLQIGSGQGRFVESRIENCHFDHDGDSVVPTPPSK